MDAFSMGTRSRIGFVVAMLAVTALPVVALAQAEVGPDVPSAATPVETSPLSGAWPTGTPLVALDVASGTVADALRQVCDQAGWGLVVTAPEAATAARLSLRLPARPAADALAVVLKAAGLSAVFDAGVVSVRAPAAPPARTGARDVEDPGDEGRSGRDSRHNGRVSIGGSVRVDAGETVDEAVSVGGSVSIAGRVLKDVVSVGGSVLLEPGAEVLGNAVAVGGRLDVQPGAVLKGDRVSISLSLGELVDKAGAFVTGGAFALPWFLLGVAATLVRALAVFVVGLLLLAVMPRRMARIREVLGVRTGASIGAGIAMIVGIGPLCVVLAVTVIGIPVIPIALLGLFVAFVIGAVVFALALGGKIRFLGGDRSPIVALALGTVLCSLVDQIPFVGTPLVFLGALVAAGAVVVSRLGAQPDAGQE